jgi:predicted DsbA family dithiol-disulfide isomerase
MSREQVDANLANLAEQAREVGLDYHLAEAIQTNTFDAHRLTYFAAEHGKMDMMAERLLKAHFTETKHLGDRETLADLAVEVGLDRERVLDVLAGGEYADEVRADEEEAQRLGIRGVPFFVIDRRFAVSGAQPVEVFLQALEAAQKEDD